MRGVVTLGLLTALAACHSGARGGALLCTACTNDGQCGGNPCFVDKTGGHFCGSPCSSCPSDFACQPVQGTGGQVAQTCFPKNDICSSPVGSDMSSSSFDGDSSPNQDGSSNQDGSIAPLTAGITITVEPDGTGVAQNLLTAIEGAKVAVHMEMYLLTNDTYITALQKLHTAGVDVKVILNESFPTGTTASETNASTYTTLTGAGVATHWAPTTTGFDNYTHEKAVVIDPGTANAQVWIMTMNLDTDAPKYNREYLALDTNAADITEAEAIFEADYAGTSITPTGSLIVAPQPPNNAQKALLALINSATSSIDIECEEYDNSGLEADIATALQNKAKAGVAVHMTLEDSTDTTQASAVAALQNATGKVVGYAYTSTGLDIHAKAVVVDAKTAFIGSENLSGGSLGYNRELGVIFDTPSEVAKVYTTITSDFAGGSTYSSQ
jgi:cardiolipin synthase A/B